MKAKFIAILIFSMICMSATAVRADTFAFTITDGPTSYFYGRTHLSGGVVTGVLSGLTNNAWSTPTGISITYADPGLGFTPGPLSNLINWAGMGFQVSNGIITDASYNLNFTDIANNAFQIRFNDQVEIAGANWLFWNGGSTPVTGVGNTAGFAGAQYVNISAVPGPMLGAGLPGIVMALGALIAWRRRRSQATVA